MGAAVHPVAGRRGPVRPPFTSERWHVDETYLRVGGAWRYLYRAVDGTGQTIDFRLSAKRDKKAAKRFFRKLPKGLRYVPRVLVTDKLRSYGAAKREIMPGVEHRQSRYLNNRAEVSHQPTRRERQMQTSCPFLP